VLVINLVRVAEVVNLEVETLVVRQDVLLLRELEVVVAVNN
jgi:hypothetical protein